MAGKAAVFAGFISLAVLFVVYSRYQNPEMIIPDAFDDIQRLAYGFYVVFAASFASIVYGLRAYHRQKLTESSKTGRMYTIAFVTNNSRAKAVFVITFLVYGVFFLQLQVHWSTNQKWIFHTIMGQKYPQFK